MKVLRWIVTVSYTHLASVFSGNTGQDNDALNGADARLTLWDLHARYNIDKLDIRALYAQGHLNDAAKINTCLLYTSRCV